VRPLAIVACFNEADILAWTLKHLIDQGCEVHVIDNWSTDGSDEIAGRYGTVEKWPQTGPIDIYDWTGILKRIEEVALKHPGRWIIFNDADEIRRAPTRDNSLSGSYSATLAEALRGVDHSGFNAISFRVVTFAPVDDHYASHVSPEAYFKHYSLDRVDNHTAHVKAWIQPVQRVDLHTHGGHQVMFPGIKVCPVQFLLKHYPIRTQAQGERKLFKERKPRYSHEERAKAWHVQYDRIVPGERLICDPSDLMLEG
jgi:glycosyltransferase involved in cell wall biosynthesis